MSSRLIIDGNAVYEIDEDCVSCEEKKPAKRGRDFSALKKQEQPETRKK